MPLYEYKCEKCDEKFEAITRITEKDETMCPKCGAHAERIISTFALGSSLSSGSGSYGGGGCWGGG